LPESLDVGLDADKEESGDNGDNDNNGDEPMMTT
jgi:hypothetical protein